MEKHSYTYILFSQRNGTLYIGVTNDLKRRVSEHKSKAIPGFTQKYGVDKLGYFEEYNDIRFAIEREKVLKGWRRDRKIKLLESVNPTWKDLYFDLF
ncbi:MAG: GIY-YIG nuclease family protein [Fibrobacter sp.]|nr:GIY-YIG nuclease family protein [Fibrobacter sp.]